MRVLEFLIFGLGAGVKWVLKLSCWSAGRRPSTVERGSGN